MSASPLFIQVPGATPPKPSPSGTTEIPVSAPEQSQGEFFGWIAVLWAVVPTIIVLMLAKSRKQKTPEPPHVTDTDFEAEVLKSDMPVLVHFYREWNIGDRVMIKQAERLAKRNGEALKVRWLEIGESPQTLARYPHVETPAFLFFFEGRLLFHAEGVLDEADVHREIWENHAKYLRKKAAGKVV